jgi:hypothetical protein
MHPPDRPKRRCHVGKRILGLLAVAAIVAACSKKDDVKPEGDASATIANNVGGDGSSADGGAANAANESDVEPVYPIEPNAPALPLAQKLCETLNELPEKKRAACCSATPGIVVTSECTRMLSAALRHHAVEIAESDVTACASAFEQTLSGCDWVGPFAPGPPAACLGIIKGKLAAGQKCRSSLECSGDQRCLGVGPTTPGKCGPQKATGDLCGGTTDTLAGYTRQNTHGDIDKRHPECKSTERCIKHKCGAPGTDGAACQTTSDCSDGLQCLPALGGAPKVGVPQKKCVARPLPKEGEACPGGVCDGELQCIKDKCAARKPTGETCSADFECKGGCLKGDAGVAATSGKCGPRCDIR